MLYSIIIVGVDSAPEQAAASRPQSTYAAQNDAELDRLFAGGKSSGNNHIAPKSHVNQICTHMRLLTYAYTHLHKDYY